jgi:hypothetical protein
MLWRSYFAFYRPSFHPHQVECSHLLASWREDFERDPVYTENVYGKTKAPVLQSSI